MRQYVYSRNAALFLLFAFIILFPSGARAVFVGDIDQDNDIDLADVILGLQVLTGGTPAIPEMVSGTDVNNDAKIGLAEVMYALQVVKVINSSSTWNDTGITWGGNYPSGNNADCTSNIAVAQDCSQGRDATHNDDSDGHAGFSFTKLDINGNSLPTDAATWNCVRDNVTGLVWEIKTDDGGIHDKDNTYRWGGKTALGTGDPTSYYSDWDSLVDGSNSEGLCGYRDWRVPTVEELAGLADYGRNNPAIDTAFFPNTQASGFWSASPFSGFSGLAWYVYFSSGRADYSNRWYFKIVRLVRSGE